MFLKNSFFESNRAGREQCKLETDHNFTKKHDRKDRLIYPV